MIQLNQIDTEQINPHTLKIDRVPTLEMLRMINDEDHLVADAVQRVLPSIAVAVEKIVEQIGKGGRLVYCGCGTSGRLGVLDAAECPPTFGTDPSLVVGLIAGGKDAFLKAVEGAEDDAAQGRRDLETIQFSPNDALVGIAASGRTPYVIGAMEYARSLGAPAIALTCSANAKMSRCADVAITPLPGPEAITGSTRMKSGTAQKMVLNMISTGVMIKLGKVYGNLMVDVKASNEKLYERAVSIVARATGADDATARRTLKKCGFSCKTAIVMLLCKLDADQAAEALTTAGGLIAKAVENNPVPKEN
jgi:N-acetylmuramic acid 6-phosphate etherase